MKGKDIPDAVVENINTEIEKINSFAGTEKELKRLIKKTQFTIIQLIAKELNLVTKNHYRNMWMAMGMAAFGIPLVVAFGTSLGNRAFIGIGIPIGFAIGLAIGTGLDKKAAQEGRQLDVEINQ